MAQRWIICLTILVALASFAPAWAQEIMPMRRGEWAFPQQGKSDESLIAAVFVTDKGAHHNLGKSTVACTPHRNFNFHLTPAGVTQPAARAKAELSVIALATRNSLLYRYER
jgi:hypothetical protein